MAEQPVNRDPLVERSEIVKILERAGVDEHKIATALRGMKFPDRVSRLEPKLQHLGITRDKLIDRMGGSP
jgi:hypothetical protein